MHNNPGHVILKYALSSAGTVLQSMAVNAQARSKDVCQFSGGHQRADNQKSKGWIQGNTLSSRSATRIQHLHSATEESAQDELSLPSTLGLLSLIGRGARGGLELP